MTLAVGGVITALVTTFDGVTGFALPAAAGTTDVVIYDGPVPTADRPTTYVLVGSTGEDADDATSSMDQSSLGPGSWHDEAGEVFCSAWSWTGDTDIAAVRTIALATFESCRAAIAADRSLGGVLSQNGLAQVTGMSLRQQQTTAGAICRVNFTVTFSTTLTA